MAGALVLRKRRDGTTTIESGVPDEHVFSARFIEREIPAGLVEVTVTLKTDDGDVTYQLEGFEPLDDAQPNFVAWRCKKTGKKARRRG